MKLLGISRDGENEQVLLASFSRRPTDDELRRLHEEFRSVMERIFTEPVTDVQRSIRDGTFGVRSIN